LAFDTVATALHSLGSSTSDERRRLPISPIVVTVASQYHTQLLCFVFILSTYEKRAVELYQALLGVSRLEEAEQTLTEALRLDPANQVRVKCQAEPGTPAEHLRAR